METIHGPGGRSEVGSDSWIVISNELLDDVQGVEGEAHGRVIHTEHFSGGDENVSKPSPETSDGNQSDLTTVRKLLEAIDQTVVDSPSPTTPEIDASRVCEWYRQAKQSESRNLQSRRSGTSHQAPHSSVLGIRVGNSAVLVVLLGLCLHSYHTCESMKDASLLMGSCEGSSVATPVPLELWPLLMLIVRVVERCVFGYVLLFGSCWSACLLALTKMIIAYLKFLEVLVDRLTAWPMNLIGVLGVGISLLGVALILEVILRHLFPVPR
eukprot:TRINITY_DN124944_c0_g1_i1.p1 TRINITY_DN124944_c0_g1~~TRINITY_DN124944_c0_g1_i1.p1  ORF type:complete len:268 (+),score=24.91 TRINITY_DN124944_c0_g1_i1:143-946(+)